MEIHKIIMFVAATSFGAPAMSATSTPLLISSTICPKPTSPLSSYEDPAHVDPESPKPMTEDTKVASLEVSSAFAAQRGGNGVNWCVLYEVKNNGPDTIPHFYWHLMAEKFQQLSPNDGLLSFKITLPPGYEPTVKPTQISGFKGQSIDTRAYQQASQAPAGRSLITLLSRRQITGLGRLGVISS